MHPGPQNPMLIIKPLHYLRAGCGWCAVAPCCRFSLESDLQREGRCSRIYMLRRQTGGCTGARALGTPFSRVQGVRAIN